MTDGRDDWAPLEPGTPPPPAPPSSPTPPPPPPLSGYPPPLSGYPPPPPGYPPQRPKAGDARTGPLPLHPMGVGDVLDGAFKLFKANARTVVLIVAAIILPVQVATSFALRHQLQFGVLNIVRDPTLARAAADQRQSGSQIFVQLLSVLVGLLVTPFVAGAISRVVAASYLGREIRPSDALRVALRRFPALLIAFVLVHLIEGVGFVLCVLPGIAASAMFTVVAPAIAVEEIGPVRAMQRSWQLVKPRFWPVLGISLLAGFIARFLGQILATAPSLVGVLFGGTYAWVLIAIAGVLASLITTPIITITATLLYFDARIRNEGFDLQVMASHLDRGAGAA
jgi:hypothetical protein